MKAFRRLRDQSGFALFMVLWVLTLLTVIVGQFCFSMRTEANLTLNFKAAAEAAYIAEAGVSRAIWELLPETPVPDGGEAPTDADERPWRVNAPIPAVAFGAGAYTVRIDNDSGRIDLNTADRGLLRLAVERLPVDEARKDVIVDSILDWRDQDELHRLNGAESDYYRALPRPYYCKNGPFDTAGELMLVRGVTPELFHGGLDMLVTASPLSGAARRSAGRGGINVNAAPPAVLALLPEMGGALAQAVFDHRAVAGDFKNLNDVKAIVGGDVFAAIAPYITLAMSPSYTIRAEGRVDGSRVRQAVTARVVIDPNINGGYRVVRRLLNDRRFISAASAEAGPGAMGG